MAKNIVFCADGTWNNPSQNHDGDDVPDPTNVYKFFVCLGGVESPATLLTANEQEKELVSNGMTVQISKYIHGVGDSRNPIGRIIGGAFGAGVISRIVRGYTFISRNYEPGANIFIVGFSRGAYTARALAGLIASEGVLVPTLTVDQVLFPGAHCDVGGGYPMAGNESGLADGGLERSKPIGRELRHGTSIDGRPRRNRNLRASGKWPMICLGFFPKSH
jgi:hypothetical protein